MQLKTTLYQDQIHFSQVKFKESNGDIFYEGFYNMVSSVFVLYNHVQQR